MKHLWAVEYQDLSNASIDIGVSNFEGTIILNKQGEKLINYKILRVGMSETGWIAKEFPNTIMLISGAISYSIPSQAFYNAHNKR